MRAWLLPAVAIAAFGQTQPLRERVLILVNDRLPESVQVGRYYAERREIPSTNILRLKTATTETVSMEEYKDQIENPLRKFLDANNGAMRKRILYVVPVFGIPFKVPDKLAVDSMIAAMYVGHEDQKPPLRNPYYAPTGSRPPKFAGWSDGPATGASFKMFVVTRLDGPTAAIAKGLVDKAIEGEKTVTVQTGVAYFDYQGTRKKDEWQYAIDGEIKEGAERAKALGFQTVLHTQASTICHGMIPPATQYIWDDAKKMMVLSTRDSTGGFRLPLPGVKEADFTVRFQDLGITMQNAVTLYFAAGERSMVRLVYPFVPFSEYNGSDDAVLEKVADGTVAARATLKMTANPQVVNVLGDLKLSVRTNRISVWRAGAEILSLEDKTAKTLEFSGAGVSTQCWQSALRLAHVEDAAGKVLWHDEFTSDTSARYQWQITPAGGLNAMWVWGWYSGAAPDSYRFLPGAVGAQLTSYTAARLRTPFNADPKFASLNADRWMGNWVPRMLEEGVTATWGAVEEPYATLYPRGPNVFDHLWAGYNFGDSLYIAQNALRWVIVGVGDPLYTPFGKK